MAAPLLALTGISKAFVPGFKVLDNVSLAFGAGQIHAVLGENGAGKSTLLNILFGIHQPDEGGILRKGREVIHRAPADAIASRIGMVHQHFKLVGSFTVAENLRLAAPPRLRARLAREADIARLAADFGLPIDPRAIVSTLPLSLQQRVEILKALLNEAELILFDEPTTILTPAEIASFYAVLRGIAAQGRAVVVVTHHLNEVIEYADIASVIRRGRLISSGPVAGRAVADFVQDMVGHELEQPPLQGAANAPGETELRLDKVSVAPTPSSAGLRDVSLDLRAGEIVGIAGVEGNGQRELFELVSGFIKPEAGRITARQSKGGRPVAGLVPEDRHREGLVPDLPIALNLLLNKFSQAPFSRHGVLRHAALNSVAETMREAADVRARSVHVTPRTLSGGNQQKIVLARALNEDAALLAVYQPTRGLDVAASEDILRRLRDAADAGRAVLFISSNLDEVMRISDRIIIFYEGRAVGEAGPRSRREEIGALMTGAAA